MLQSNKKFLVRLATSEKEQRACRVGGGSDVWSLQFTDHTHPRRR